MPGRVPWERYSGDEIEAIIASFISTRHPDAVRIRPSKGDKGIDIKRVKDDGSLIVYQVKSFSSNLAPSQKNQIRDSWNSLIEYVSEEGLVLAEWHLVMPLDPTLENERWLKEVTANFGGDAFWRGLSQVDAWAAEMPKIVDYYINGGRDAVTNEVRLALAAARLPDITNSEGLVTHLNELQKRLSGLDPHYDYRLRILDKELDDINKLKLKPGLVMTTMEFADDDRVIAIDVYAKSNLAHELAPIKEKVTLVAKSEAEKNQLRDFVDFGVPLKNFPGKYEYASLPFAFEGDREVKEIFLSTVPLTNSPLLNASLRNIAGIALRFTQTCFTSGQRGFVWEGESELGFLNLRISGMYKTGKTDYIFRWTHDAFVNANVSKTRRILNFMKSGEKFPFDVIVQEAKAASVAFSDSNSGNEFSFDLIDHELVLAKSLEKINALSDREICFPDIRKLDSAVYFDVLRAADLSTGGSVAAEWHQFKMDNPYEAAKMVDGPVKIIYILPFEVKLNDAFCDCGMMIQTEFIGRIVKEDDAHYCTPVKGYGSYAIQRAFERTPDIVKMSNQLYAMQAPSVQEWHKLVESCRK